MVYLKMGDITQKWVDLVKPFCRDYSAKISVNEIAKNSRIPQQTASRVLDKMVKINLINYERKGKNKLFYFDLEKTSTTIIFNIVENQRALEFLSKNKKIAIVINEFLRIYEGVIVFGSYASEKFDEKSDLDLVIFGDKNKELMSKIKRNQSVEINEHFVNYNEFEKILKNKNPLAIEIKQNHILFGNVSKIVEIFWRIEYERR